MTMTHPQPGTRECGCPEYGGMSRRTFLASAAGVGALTGLASVGLSTRMAFAAAPYTGDVVVVLSLRGGMDGLNVVVPTADANYYQLRPTISIPQNALLQLDATFGLHPAMSALMPWWNNGSLGFVHAVGQASPTRSHFDAMAEMERAAPGSGLRTGWLDRTLGLRDPGTAFQGCQIGSGMAAAMFTGPFPELAMWSVDDFSLSAASNQTDRDRWSAALSALHAGARMTLAQPVATTLDALDKAAAIQASPPPVDPAAAYPVGSDLGNALADVAKLIKSDVGLQVAAIDYGDWDMHSDMGTADSGWLHDHLTEFSQALAAFATDLGPRFANVTVITLTEFGRRVEENGSGADHGHGQAVLLLGGGVVGGQVHGTWPTLAPDKLVDGDLDGTTDYRTLLAEILEKRCDATGMDQVFPGLSTDRLGVVTQHA
jgi:uncharacterized protein (DUF1501 family)